MPNGGGDPGALKKAIHIASIRAGITSDMDLSVKAGVHYDTLMNWYGGRTVPRTRQLLMIAKVCGVSLETLQAPYEGRELEPDSVTEALRAHTRAVERQNELLGSLVAALTAGAAGVAAALSPPTIEQERNVLAVTLGADGSIDVAKPSPRPTPLRPRRTE